MTEHREKAYQSQLMGFNVEIINVPAKISFATTQTLANTCIIRGEVKSGEVPENGIVVCFIPEINSWKLYCKYNQLEERDYISILSFIRNFRG